MTSVHSSGTPGHHLPVPGESSLPPVIPWPYLLEVEQALTAMGFELHYALVSDEDISSAYVPVALTFTGDPSEDGPGVRVDEHVAPLVNAVLRWGGSSLIESEVGA